MSRDRFEILEVRILSKKGLSVRGRSTTLTVRIKLSPYHISSLSFQMYKNKTVKKKKKTQSRQRTQVRLMKSIPTIVDGLLVKMVLANQTITTSAFGIVNVTTNWQSDQCSQFPSGSWASYAARFGQYRVHAMALHLHPTMNVNAGVIATNLLSTMHISDFISTVIPTTASGIVGDSSWREISTAKPIHFRTTWERNTNAKLWSPTNAAIPIDRRFGIAFCSHTNVNLLPVNTIIYTLSADFLVEFKQAGF